MAAVTICLLKCVFYILKYFDVYYLLILYCLMGVIISVVSETQAERGLVTYPMSSKKFAYKENS